MSHLLFSGTEDLGLDVAPASDDAVAEVVEIRAEIAEAAAEMAEQADTLEEIKDVVLDIQEATEEVQEAVEGMESMIQSGNFDARGFAALYNNANKACARALDGAIEGRDLRIGAESLYDASTASALVGGMEGFMDKVKAGGSKAVAYIKQLFARVVAFITGLFNKTAGLKKKIALLNGKLGGDAKLKEKVKLGSWNGYIDYANGGFSDKTLALAELSAPLAEYAGLLDGEITLSAFQSKYNSLVSSMKAKVSAAGASKSDKGDTVAQIAGIRVVFKTAEGGTDDLAKAAKTARGLGLKSVKSEEFSKLASGESVAPKANASVLKSVLTNVGNSLTKVENAKVDQKFAAAKREKLIGYLNAAGEDEDKKQKAELIKAVCASSVGLVTSVNTLVTQFAAAYLDGVDAHI